MRVLRKIIRALPLGIALLGTSCAIRLPEAPQQRVQVSMDAPATRVAAAPDADGRDPDVLVWMVADKLHTGMIFPYDWLLESGFVPPENFGTPRFVSMSWGDRAAYVQERWLNPAQVVHALFLPSPAVMELIPMNWDVVEVVPNQRIYRKLVPREQGVEVTAFLNHCSRTGADGKPVVLGPSSWGGGVLLESRHSYYFPRICNVWTAQAIEACGVELNALQAVSANGLIKQVETPSTGFEQIWWGHGTSTASAN